MNKEPVAEIVPDNFLNRLRNLFGSLRRQRDDKRRSPDAENKENDGKSTSEILQKKMNHTGDIVKLSDDFHVSFAHKHQRNARLRWLMTVVSGGIIASWCIGASGVSLAWLVLLLAAILAVWSSTLVQLIEDVKNDEILRVRRRRALSRDETAEWLNFLFNRWWVCSSKSVFHILQKRFEPLLNDVKPAFVEKVELRQFTFGDQTPCVKSIKAYDIVEGKRLPLTNYTLEFPPGSSRHPQRQVAMELDLYLNSDEFRMILGTRLFGKGVGVDLDIAMEKLNLCGKLDVTLTVDMESPFPHVTDVTLMFTEKPEIWFSVRMLKTVQMMEVPVLKTWIHSVIMDALETSLVDPGKVHFNLSQKKGIAPGVEKGVSVAQGVLTVTLSASQLGYTNGDLKWLVLKLGEQYWRTSPVTQNWSETPSFLIESLQTDKLVVKLKSKRLVSTVALAQYEMHLEEYNLENAHIVETLLQKKGGKVSNIPNISVRLEYTPLPSVSLDEPYSNLVDTRTVCGVFTVFIHGAQGLTYNDANQFNPYCMLFCNRRKVKTTQCIYSSTSPQWKSRCQFLVSDYTQTSLSFVLCSWNPKKVTDDEMLGVAVLNFSEGETWLVNRQLPLSGSAHNMASINVSAVFQPVTSMTNKVYEMPPSPGSDMDSKSDSSNGKNKRNSSSWVQQAKSFLGRTEQETQSGSDISNILASGLGLMEISVLRARDLVAMDMNGFSDPYCELKVNSECKYKSSVKKKTLNPVWEENAIMGMPRPGETFDVMVWDHDTFGMKDFLGSVTLTADEIRQMSSLDCSTWYTLQGVRSGEVELKIRVISDDTSFEVGETKDNYSQNATMSSSGKRTNPNVTRNSSEQSPIIRRPSMERSRVRLGVNIPPPTPPRTVSIPQQKTVGQTLVQEVHRNLTNGVGFLSDHSAASSVHSVPVPRVTVTDSPSMTRASSRASSQVTADLSIPPTPSPEESHPTKKQHDPELTAFRSMKQKVSRSLRLRRFKSEVNVRAQNSSKTMLEPRGSGEADATDLLQLDALSHAVSQPNIHKIKTPPVRPTELNICPTARPDKYSGVEGKVVQAQGLHVAHVAQLYCRIKLIGSQSGEKLGRGGQNSNGKTLAKSHLLPAMPNPQFDLSFQISSPESVPRQAVLLFEIRSSGKEVVALRRVTLQDLLSGDGKETHTWLALSNGATLEVTIAHGREIKKPSRRLFRSWSVHRIGRI